MLEGRMPIQLDSIGSYGEPILTEKIIYHTVG
jgi:hypothetical protein